MYIPAGMELLHKNTGYGVRHTDAASCHCCPRLVTHSEAEKFRALGGYMERDDVDPFEADDAQEGAA